MKRFFILTLLMSTFFVASIAQNQRLVLAEGFSSATCGPCASQNPAWNALLHANEDIVTSVKYQMSWPAPGTDPMYHHNPTDNTARRNYYNVNSVPQAVINGNHFQGAPNGVNQTMLQTVAAVTSPFRIQMQHYFNDAMDSVFVNMLIKADAPVSGTLVAHIAVIEKHIQFATPPGTNGETNFYNIMKALLPTRNGTSLPNFQGTEYVLIQAAWKLANVYNIDQIAAVGFIQNNDNKHVHQAANSSTDPIVPFFENDATIAKVLNYTKMNCSGSTSPRVVLTNHGSNQLTSAHIVASINGIELYSESWSGNLGFLEKEVIDLGEFTFNVEATNQLVVEITSTNGGDDDYPENTIKTAAINAAVNTSGNVTLFLLLDSKPEETTWELVNTATGEVVQSGGPYSSPGAVQVPLQVSDNNCYEFVIYDSGGDGICCGHGTGYYGVLHGNNQPMFTGSNFGYIERNQFGYGLVGLEEVRFENAFHLSPNPVVDQAFAHISLEKTSNVEVGLYDVTGRKINAVDYGILSAGSHQLADWFVAVPKGIYIVKVQAGAQTFTQKLVVQ